MSAPRQASSVCHPPSQIPPGTPSGGGALFRSPTSQCPLAKFLFLKTFNHDKGDILLVPNEYARVAAMGLSRAQSSNDSPPGVRWT